MHSRLYFVFAAMASISASLGAQPATQPLPADSAIDLHVTPSLVGEGVLSASRSEFGAALSPDGQSIVFTVTDFAFSRMTLVDSRQNKGRWSTPRVAAFSGLWNDGDPSMSPDGRRLFFISNRPAAGDSARTDFDVWFVDRQPNGSWSNPHHVGEGVNSSANVAYPTAAGDGTLYYQQGPAIMRAPLLPSGDYGPGDRVVLGDGQTRFLSPAIAPNGTTLFLIGQGSTPRDGGDLYVSFRKGDSWTQPKRLASPVSTPFSETAPSVSADGKTLYFSSERVARSVVTWPRSRRLETLADVYGELDRVTLNGLRNIYSVDISGLAP